VHLHDRRLAAGNLSQRSGLVDRPVILQFEQDKKHLKKELLVVCRRELQHKCTPP
jgi:hypothetical protein